MLLQQLGQPPGRGDAFEDQQGQDDVGDHLARGIEQRRQSALPGEPARRPK